MIKEFKQLDFYGKLAISGILVMVFGGLASLIFKGTYKIFIYEGQPYNYLYKELFAMLSDFIGQLFLVLSLRHCYVKNKLARGVFQWAVDLILINCVFAITGNPFGWDSYVIYSMLISTVISFLIFYFEGYFLPFYKKKK